MNILDSIRHWATVGPDRLVHISGERMLTYGELAHRSDLLADYLLRTYTGVNAQRPIAVRGHKEPEMLIAFLGAIKAGHAYVPIDIAIPHQRFEYMVKTAQAVTVLTPEVIDGLTSGTSSAKIDPVCAVAHSDPFYIMFTSGSTGDPKGVVITANNLECFLNWLVHEQQFTPQNEVFLDQAPFSFDLSVMDLYSALVTGGTIFSVHKDEIANPAQLYRTLAHSNVTTWVSTPSFAQLCLIEKSFSQARLPHLRRFLFCGETLSVDVVATLSERFPQATIWNTYGPTEATVAMTSIKIDANILKTYKPLPVGYVQPECRVLIIDEAGTPLPEKRHGQIVITGANVSPGYIGRPDLSQKAFWQYDGLQAYYTGDQGYFYNGLLFFEGRQDNQIKLHGHRIEIGDIESNLQALPHVRDALVVVKKKDGVPNSLAAFVIYDGEELPEVEKVNQLRTALSEWLPAYMIPRRFYFLDVFPMTTNGKADRQKLAEICA